MKYTPCLNEECIFTQTPKEFCVCHHVFNGNPNRKLSEEWGMKIWVHPLWHDNTPYSIHKNEETDIIVKQYAQAIFEERHGHDKFMEVFKRNWL